MKHPYVLTPDVRHPKAKMPPEPFITDKDANRTVKVVNPYRGDPMFDQTEDQPEDLSELGVKMFKWTLGLYLSGLILAAVWGIYWLWVHFGAKGLL